MTRSRFGRIVLEDRVAVGRLTFGERIVAIDVDARTEAQAGAPDDLPWILPGFVDVHVHGGGGGDAMDGPAGVRTLAAAHLRHGTTTLLPTTLTAPWSDVTAALRGIAAVRAEADPDLPALPGAHLEGPFISPDRLGAQPPHAQRPTPEKLDELLALDVVRVATVAPEIPAAKDAAERLARAGVRVSVGHTRADADTADAFLATVAAAGGTAGATHLFNAMGGIEGRAPGTAGAVLASDTAYAELICDGHHVARAAAMTALRAKGRRLLLITDAIRAAATDAHDATLGGQPVRIEGGAARLADGTLAGSVLTMDRAVATLIAFGATWPEVAHAAATAPAGYLGLDDRGALRPGLRADLVLLDADGAVLEVVRGGRTVAGAAID
jgi:N-acetylglucosamine-6-phosphate deacetylase